MSNITVLSCVEYAAAAALNGSAFLPDCDSCLEKLFPCSQTVVGNMILMCAYGFILSCGAKLISDGAEMLLEVSNPVIVGGLVLPILGALPDAAMILVSGLGPDAQEQLSVGVGTLAGSTIMLLTIPWLGGLLIGRCDINPSSGDAIDKKCSKFSWFQQVGLSGCLLELDFFRVIVLILDFRV
jgi:Ca2+/Na+ antiporter